MKILLVFEAIHFSSPLKFIKRGKKCLKLWTVCDQSEVIMFYSEPTANSIHLKTDLTKRAIFKIFAFRKAYTSWNIFCKWMNSRKQSLFIHKNLNYSTGKLFAHALLKNLVFFNENNSGTITGRFNLFFPWYFVRMRRHLYHFFSNSKFNRVMNLSDEWYFEK